MQLPQVIGALLKACTPFWQAAQSSLGCSHVLAAQEAALLCPLLKCCGSHYPLLRSRSGKKLHGCELQHHLLDCYESQRRVPDVPLSIYKGACPQGIG